MMQHITTGHLNNMCLLPLDLFPKRGATSKAKIYPYTQQGRGLGLKMPLPTGVTRQNICLCL